MPLKIYLSQIRKPQILIVAHIGQHWLAHPTEGVVTPRQQVAFFTFNKPIVKSSSCQEVYIIRTMMVTIPV